VVSNARKTARAWLIWTIAGLMLPCAALGARGGYDYIDITNPFMRKIPMAVPYFKTAGALEREVAASREAADLLADTLDFTAYFKILDRGAFLFDPQSMPVALPGINFQNWKAVGAELLVTGGVAVSGEDIELELRLFDTLQGKMLLGKRYPGPYTDQRRIIRRFCSEVIFVLTGKRGFFDSEIAFVSTGTGNKEIYISDFDGSSPRQLSRSGEISMSPAWSSDTQWLAYSSYIKGKPALLIRHRSDGRGALFQGKGIKVDPAWIPGKLELAATLSYEGDPEIYLLTGGGKVIKRLTDSPGIDVSPSWSPDGSQMAFVSRRSGSPQIYIKDMASGAERRLTYQGQYNQQPSWSPAGDQIAYTTMEKNAIDICRIGVDGRGLLQLTHGSGDNEASSWSPDGSMLVFSSTREGVSRIYVMTAFGTDQRRLLTLPGGQSEPSWSMGSAND